MTVATLTAIALPDLESVKKFAICIQSRRLVWNRDVTGWGRVIHRGDAHSFAFISSSSVDASVRCSSQDEHSRPGALLGSHSTVLCMVSLFSVQDHKKVQALWKCEVGGLL